MIEKTNATNKGDYSCEIVSLVVIAILSGLSHFWYVLIAIGIAIVSWVSIVVLGKLLRFVAGTFPWNMRAGFEKNSNAGDSGNQVFQPSKIRQSVDC